MKYDVIKCSSPQDQGVSIKRFTGILSWFKAFHLATYCSNMDDGFIYGLRRVKK